MFSLFNFFFPGSSGKKCIPYSFLVHQMNFWHDPKELSLNTIFLFILIHLFYLLLVNQNKLNRNHNYHHKVHLQFIQNQIIHLSTFFYHQAYWYLCLNSKLYEPFSLKWNFIYLITYFFSHAHNYNFWDYPHQLFYKLGLLQLTFAMKLNLVF